MAYLQYHEHRQRGTPDFPLDYHYIDAVHPRYEMPYHWHEEFELLHVRRGSFRLTVDGETHLMTAGDIAFISAGSLHGGLPGDCEYDCVVFDLRLLLKTNDHCKQYIGDILHRRIAVTTHFPAGSKVTTHALLPLFEALHDGWDGSSLIALGCLFRFVGEVYKYRAYQSEPSKRGVDCTKMLKLKKVLELMESEYASPLSLSRLSATLNMTPKYFCRFFKEATHKSPLDYLNYYRIEMACYHFAASEQNITETAFACGFNNLTYFIKTFKRYKGMTPGQYLRLQRAGA